MEWFKHDSNTTQDAKIKKLLIRYGDRGYAVYFHCLELIVSDVSKTNLTFKLEHDSEIIADNLRIHGTADKSGQEIVEDIMRYMIELGLFTENSGAIYGLKVLKRLDTSMTSNKEFREMITEAKERHDMVMIPSCKIDKKEEIDKIDKTNKNRKRENENNHDYKMVSGEIIPINNSIHESLIGEYGNEIIEDYYQRIYDYCQSNGKKYKDYSATARNWIKRDIDNGRTIKKQQPSEKYGQVIKGECPACGSGYNSDDDMCWKCKLPMEDFDNQEKVIEFRERFEEMRRKAYEHRTAN